MVIKIRCLLHKNIPLKKAGEAAINEQRVSVNKQQNKGNYINFLFCKTVFVALRSGVWTNQ
jgi:hypothetical protein